MTSQQQVDYSFEIKVPIFCEWILQKHLELPESSSLYNYLFDRLDDDGSVCLSTPEYSLPGFPGIKYYLILYMRDTLRIDYSIITEYGKYNFDADFTCFITDCKPKHIIHNFNDDTDEDMVTSFELCSCLDDCDGCPACVIEKVTVRVEGAIIVKRVEDLARLIGYKNARIKNKTELPERNGGKDFVIVVEEHEIRVHKAILEEHSTVFARMLDTDTWKETIENKIVIPDFSHKIVEFAIDDCYCKTFFKPLRNKEEYLMLFQFADKYDMKKLIEAAKIITVFTPNNVAEYANFFFQNNAIELVNCCIDYIFACSQYSLPIKDIKMLDSQICGMFFDRALVCPVLKKDQKIEHRSFYE